jgi:hypothetical protein
MGGCCVIDFDRADRAVGIRKNNRHGFYASGLGGDDVPGSLGWGCLRFPAQSRGTAIEFGEVVFGLGVTLFRGLAIPPYRFTVILWNTPAIGVHVTHGVLRVGISLFCGLAIPQGGLGVALRHTPAVLVRTPKFHCASASP